MSEPVGPPSVPSIQMQPVPTEDEAAAIVAALTLLAGGGGTDDETPPVDPRWRFSGRWWTRPVPVSRARPYRG